MKFLRNTALLILSIVTLSAALFLTSCEKEHTHSFGEWTTVNEPTCASEGLKKQKCSCGEERTEKIPMLTEHKLSGGDCTVCGYQCPHTNAQDSCADCGAQKQTYTVTVTDALGTPLPMTLVKIFRGETEIGTNFTGLDGKVTFSLIDGKHSFTLEAATDGLDYDINSCILSAALREKTVVLYDALSAKTEIYGAFSSEGQKYAYFISEGKEYSIALEKEELSYFIFSAERTGVYKITVNSDTDINVGVYGGPMYVLQYDITASSSEFERENAYTILIDVAPKHLPGGDRAEATKTVIGVKSDAATTSGVLIVERVFDHVMTPEDYPWQTYGGGLNPEPYLPDAAQLPGFTVTDLDITNPSLAIVYNESDGYYHHMTEDGPIVLVKLDIPTKYLETAISKMAETQAFACYLYNEDGSYKEKLTFQEMLLKYIDACSLANGGIGAYPLDEHLMKLLKDVGGAWGWYELDSNKNTQIFGDDSAKIVPENAWMFALCYAEILESAHNVTLKNEGGEPLVAVNVTVTDDEGVVLATATTDENGVATLTFKHLGDCFVKLEEATLEDYTVNEADLKLEGANKTITLTAVNKDGGENINGYNPEEKYLRYNWETVNIKIQINENSHYGSFPSSCRRYLAGESSNTAQIDELILKRNREAAKTCRTNVEYIYIADNHEEYSWGSAGSTISKLILANGASAPDVFCDSACDLVTASLKNCLYNISKSGDNNNFSFTELGYKESGKSFGYLNGLMSELSFFSSKQYILASDYLIDTVRGLNVIPVNSTLLEALLDDKINSTEKLHALIKNGGWTFSTLLNLAAQMSEQGTKAVGFLVDSSSESVMSAFLYSRNFEIFSRTETEDTGEYFLEFLDTGSHFSAFFADFKSIISAAGVSVLSESETGTKTLFCDNGALLGGILPIGALEDEEYKKIAASGLYIAPIPKSNVNDSYKSILDSRARLVAINAKTRNFAAVSAFLDYQTTHSENTMAAFLKYSLLWGTVGASNENKDSLELIRASFSPSFVYVYDEQVNIHFKRLGEEEAGISWHELYSSELYSPEDISTVFRENAEKRQKYYEYLVKMVREGE